MYELSPADGFVEISECVDDMIKYLANEPSVGLFYVQQHVQNAAPNVIRLKNDISEKSQAMSLHTEDLEDSITATRSMKECGFPIVDEMIRDIRTSLDTISTKHPVQGLVPQPGSSFGFGRAGSWGPGFWGRKDGDKMGGYFSGVLKSAKEKAGNFKFATYPNEKGASPAEGSSCGEPDKGETDELPLSGPVADGIDEDENISTDAKGTSHHHLLSKSGDFDEFKADREARLEEWLKGSGRNLEEQKLERISHFTL